MFDAYVCVERQVAFSGSVSGDPSDIVLAQLLDGTNVTDIAKTQVISGIRKFRSFFYGVLRIWGGGQASTDHKNVF